MHCFQTDFLTLYYVSRINAFFVSYEDHFWIITDETKSSSTREKLHWIEKSFEKTLSPGWRTLLSAPRHGPLLVFGAKPEKSFLFPDGSHVDVKLSLLCRLVRCPLLLQSDASCEISGSLSVKSPTNCTDVIAHYYWSAALRIISIHVRAK